jgi:hypothetical protein
MKHLLAITLALALTGATLAADGNGSNGPMAGKRVTLNVENHGGLGPVSADGRTVQVKSVTVKEHGPCFVRFAYANGVEVYYSGPYTAVVER